MTIEDLLEKIKSLEGLNETLWEDRKAMAFYLEFEKRINIDLKEKIKSLEALIGDQKLVIRSLIDKAEREKMRSSRPDQNGKILLSMRFWPQTIEKMETLKRTLNAENKTTAVRAAIDIALFITDEISFGSKITVRRGNGEQDTVIVRGLNDK